MGLERRLDHGEQMESRGNDESQERVLDGHVLDELIATLGNDTTRVQNVYRKFVDTTSARLVEVRTQSVTESAATFHALKGSASMVGANRLAALAAKLQEAAPGLDNETKVSAVIELETELALFRDALNAVLRPSTDGR
jgi:HPt (histidine-containing phosphotransfer) domain-containing protein